MSLSRCSSLPKLSLHYTGINNIVYAQKTLYSEWRFCRSVVDWQVLYRHVGGNRDGAFTDWFSFTVTSGARSSLTPVSGVFWVVVELTDRELPALDANVPLTVIQGDLETITSTNLHISQAGTSASFTLYSVILSIN